MVPQDSCINLYPIHNSTKLLSNAPVEILINKNIYHPNEIIKVSLIGVDDFRFIGFVLQARVYQKKTIVGTWNLENTNHEFIGILKCFETNNSLVHAWPEFYKEKNKYFTNITAFWLAPKLDNYEIEFVATVVQQYDKFWTDIKSKRIAPNNLTMINKGVSYKISYSKILFLTFLLLI